MPQIDVKVLLTQLKKNEIHNLYYLYGKNINGVENATKAIIKKTVGEYQDFALTKIDGKSVNISELSDVIEMLPMMSEYNCILINDYNCNEQREDMNKKLIEVLKDIPSQTVVIFNVTGFDVNDGKKKMSAKNKNKKLVDFIAKNGIVCEQALPSSVELSKYIIAKVSKNGCSISERCAEMLAEYCLYDPLLVSNEINKLCSYAVNTEITSDMINLLVPHQSDIDVYKLADAICRFDRNKAFQALDELLAKKIDRTQILFAVSNSFVDLYRAGVAKKYGKQTGDVTADFGYVWEFAVKNAFRDSSRISVSRLRKCTAILRDTAMTLNSTGADEKIVIEEAIAKMLLLSD